MHCKNIDTDIFKRTGKKLAVRKNSCEAQEHGHAHMRLERLVAVGSAQTVENTKTLRNRLIEKYKYPPKTGSSVVVFGASSQLILLQCAIHCDACCSRRAVFAHKSLAHMAETSPNSQNSIDGTTLIGRELE